MVKFTFTQQGSLMREIMERAKDAKPVLKQWASFLKAGARQAFIDKAPPLAASTVEKQATSYTGAVTKNATVRSSAARALDAKLKRKGSAEARAELRQLLAGDLSKGTSGNRTVDRLRRRLIQAKKAKEAGMNIASGKSKLERSGGERGGKMGKAFRAKVESLRAIVTNVVKYSRVHDEGGAVGNGATLPYWGFMHISQDATARLADIALRWLMRGE